MVVGADLEVAAVLALIAVGIHVADDGVLDLADGVGKQRHGPDTSTPPLWVKTPNSLYWRTLSRVKSVISLEWSVRKMKFEACPVDPPGLGSEPLSIRTISFQPCCARW